ncbi:MAG: apolipoprotein N-acyltransferase, partial [Candidatus Omnitrophota bacterium]
MKIGPKEILYAVLAGLLMALAAPLVIGVMSEAELFSGSSNEVFAWFALIPLFLAMEGKTGRTAFRIGTLAGLVYFSIVLYWIVVALTVFGGIPYVGAIPILGLLIIYCSLYWGAAAGITAYICGSLRTPLALVAPIVFTALEFARNFLLSGFPWGNIAYTQYKNLLLVQISSITGVYGIVFLLVLSSAVIHEWIMAFKYKHVGKPIVGTIVFSILIMLSFAWGMHRSKLLGTVSHDSKTIKVEVLQGNIDQLTKNNDYQYRGGITGIYNRLTNEAEKKKPDLIIWPEASYPIAVPRDLTSFRTGWSLLEPSSSGSFTFMGATAFYTDGDKRLLYNSAFLLDPSLRVMSRYDKTHLVPFGEYVPLGLPIEKIVSGFGEFTPGKDLTPPEFVKGGREIRLGPLICYEGIFPEISRTLVRNGANIMVNLTN